MTVTSVRVARRRRTRALVALGAASALLAIAAACGFDGAPSGDFPVQPEPVEAGSDANLPPRTDAAEPDASLDAGPDVLAPACPTSGGAMVMVDAGGLSFCIDATEVTVSEYDKFVAATDGGLLDAGPDAGSACAVNASYARGGVPPADAGNLPAVQIDWCDARDYCAWAGKHLCGKQIAGDASTGEWFAACSNGGLQPFPYGATYKPLACNEGDAGGTIEAVKKRAACEGGAPGVYDLNGNASEWVDNCVGTNCSAMGGDYSTQVAHGCAVDVEYARTSIAPTLGFRCCAAPQ
jgi:formylglycine-generating enzyme required for sulfatase activity